MKPPSQSLSLKGFDVEMIDDLCFAVRMSGALLRGLNATAAATVLDHRIQ
ncbi:MAG: hypothetical protein QOG21_2251 [Actinomycetota bacterium]|jgi:hypothetical protein|nr:hypothetical protein [Actinomycetota bacterium]